MAAGGAWAIAPAPIVALALVDVLRRPGAGQFALDHARLLAPLGSIPDPDERRAMVADLVDDLLAPLGTVVTPAGMRTGRSAGSVSIRGMGGSTERELMPGGLALVDLPPGTSAIAEFRFRDTVRLGTRGRHFAIPVTGGLGGLVVDLRDVPLAPARAGRPARRAPRGVADVPGRPDRRMTAADVRLVPARRLITAPVDVLFALSPGDRPLVSAGDSVVVGAPIAERLRDPRLDEVELPDGAASPRPGARWSGQPRRGDERGPGGEYVFEWHGRWRVATGDIADAVETPFAGIVREVRPGTGITIRAAGRGIRGIVALGGPTRGRLHAGADGELRSGGLDVGSAGTILVVGSRVDAETLTRARAMGVCGVDRGRAVEQGAARLHRLGGPAASGAPSTAAVRGARPRRGDAAAAGRRRPGRARRPGRSRGGDRHGPADARLRRAEPGHPGAAGRPRPDPGGLDVRPRGPLRPGDRPAPVPGGVQLEAGIVQLPDGTDAAVPLGDLERFV